jgi:hypothetical protein
MELTQNKFKELAIVYNNCDTTENRNLVNTRIKIHTHKGKVFLAVLDHYTCSTNKFFYGFPRFIIYLTLNKIKYTIQRIR